MEQREVRTGTMADWVWSSFRVVYSALGEFKDFFTGF